MEITYNPIYNGYLINVDEEKGHGCYTKILDKYISHFEDKLNKHNKVLQTRFDLRYPSDNSVTPQKEHLYNFHRNLIKDLSRNASLPGTEKKKNAFRKKNAVDPSLIKVVEQTDSDHPHVHCILLVNGNSKRTALDIFPRVERQWANALGREDAKGLVDYCTKSGPNPLMVSRSQTDFKSKMHNPSHQASYPAKIRDKDNNPKGSWSVSSSRISKTIKD